LRLFLILFDHQKRDEKYALFAISELFFFDIVSQSSYNHIF